jgi:hypothetical protein
VCKAARKVYELQYGVVNAPKQKLYDWLADKVPRAASAPAVKERVPGIDLVPVEPPFYSRIQISNSLMGGGRSRQEVVQGAVMEYLAKLSPEV